MFGLFRKYTILKEDVSSPVDDNLDTAGIGEDTAAFLPRLLKDELIVCGRNAVMHGACSTLSNFSFSFSDKYLFYFFVLSHDIVPYYGVINRYNTNPPTYDVVERYHTYYFFNPIFVSFSGAFHLSLSISRSLSLSLALSRSL